MSTEDSHEGDGVQWVERIDERRTGYADLVDRGLTPELLVCVAVTHTELATGCAASFMIDPDQRYLLAATDERVAAAAARLLSAA